VRSWSCTGHVLSIPPTAPNASCSIMRAYHVRIVIQRTPPSKSEQTDTFTPLSLWQPLPTHTYRSTARRNATYNPRGKDYRFGPIALDWIDLDDMTPPLFVSQGRADPKGAFMTQTPHTKRTSSVGGAGCSGPAIATFVPQRHTKSGSTNLPNGVVHVFRDVERQKLAESNEGTSSPDASRVMLENADSDGFMVGVLAVPSWMTPSDFLAFVAPAEGGMAHLRMIRYAFVAPRKSPSLNDARSSQRRSPQSVHSAPQVPQARKCLGVCRGLQRQGVQFDECQSHLCPFRSP
jgi:BRCA1-associated protein